MMKRPWNTKGKQLTNHIHKVTAPGKYVSLDQLESLIPGFIAHQKGKLTKNRYRATIIFVKHFSSLSYVHLQGKYTSKETLTAKKSFEAFIIKQGVKISHYYAVNRQFLNNSFIRSDKDSGEKNPTVG